MSKTIETTRAGRVLIARLSNPPHALMSDQMIAELDELVTSAESDDGVGVVVLTGAEPNVFLTHYDVSELLHSARKAPPINEQQATAVLRWTRRIMSLSWLRKPVAKSPLAGVLKLQRMHHLHRSHQRRDGGRRSGTLSLVRLPLHRGRRRAGTTRSAAWLSARRRRYAASVPLDRPSPSVGDHAQWAAHQCAGSQGAGPGH
jgi:hypothetical protein